MLQLGKLVEGITVILDLKNVGPSMLWGPGMQMIAHMGKVVQDNYPEVVKRTYIVNGEWLQEGEREKEREKTQYIMLKVWESGARQLSKAGQEDMHCQWWVITRLTVSEWVSEWVSEREREREGGRARERERENEYVPSTLCLHPWESGTRPLSRGGCGALRKWYKATVQRWLWSLEKVVQGHCPEVVVELCC